MTVNFPPVTGTLSPAPGVTRDGHLVSQVTRRLVVRDLEICGQTPSVLDHPFSPFLPSNQRLIQAGRIMRPIVLDSTAHQYA